MLLQRLPITVPHTPIAFDLFSSTPYRYRSPESYRSTRSYLIDNPILTLIIITKHVPHLTDKNDSLVT